MLNSYLKLAVRGLRQISTNTRTHHYSKSIQGVPLSYCSGKSLNTRRGTTISTTAIRHTSTTISSENADPAMKKYKYWNREEYTRKGRYDYLIKISPESIVKEAKIISLSDVNDEANEALSTSLPFGSKLLQTGTSLDDFQHLDEKPNVVFVSPSCPMARKQLPLLLERFPSIEWVHVRSAGIDFIVSDELSSISIPITNAKGQFSSSLAEYTMMACSYFAKDLPRLLKQKQAKDWEKYNVEELRGKVLGIVGYGDIGRACAKVAHVYGMKIIALRRNPQLSKNDPYCTTVYGTDKNSLNQLMSESDYIVCSAPSTVETRGMVNRDAFHAVKEGAVFINLGRGPVIDEEALIEALKNGKLKGAALDVFSEEPLPQSNELWDLDNVLLSPHNMDQTATFMHEATEFFVYENLPRFICGKDLLNPVDPKLGY
jgi:phosphoglycerate dehydrogenase-like enzyme